MQRPLLTVKQVGRQLGISRPTVYRLINAGELRKVKIGTRTRLFPEDVDALIKRGIQAPTNGDAPPGRARRAQEGRQIALRSS